MLLQLKIKLFSIFLQHKSKQMQQPKVATCLPTAWQSAKSVILRQFPLRLCFLPLYPVKYQ